MALNIESLDYQNIFFQSLHNETESPYPLALAKGEQFYDQAKQALKIKIGTGQIVDGLARIDAFIDFLNDIYSSALTSEKNFLNKFEGILKTIFEDKEEQIPDELRNKLNSLLEGLKDSQYVPDIQDIIIAINIALEKQNAQQRNRHTQYYSLMSQQQEALDSARLSKEYIGLFKELADSARKPSTVEDGEVDYRGKTTRRNTVIYSDILKRTIPDEKRIWNTYADQLLRQATKITKKALNNPNIVAQYLLRNQGLGQLETDITTWLMESSKKIGEETTEEYFELFLNALESNPNAIIGRGRTDLFVTSTSKKTTTRGIDTIEKLVMSSTENDFEKLLQLLVSGSLTQKEGASILKDIQMKYNSINLKNLQATYNSIVDKKERQLFRQIIRRTILSLIAGKQTKKKLTIESLVKAARAQLKNRYKQGYFKSTQFIYENLSARVKGHGDFAESLTASSIVQRLQEKLGQGSSYKVSVPGKNIQLKGDIVITLLMPVSSDDQFLSTIQNGVTNSVLDIAQDMLQEQKAATKGTGKIDVSSMITQYEKVIDQRIKTLARRKGMNKAKTLEVLRRLLISEVSVKDYTLAGGEKGFDASSLGENLPKIIENITTLYSYGGIGVDISTEASNAIQFAIRNSNSTALAADLEPSVKEFLLAAGILLIFDFGFTNISGYQAHFANDYNFVPHVLNLVNVQGRFYPASLVYLQVLEKFKKIRDAMVKNMDVNQYLSDIHIIGAPSIQITHSNQLSDEANARWEAVRATQVSVELYFLTGLMHVVSDIEQKLGTIPIPT